MQYVGFPNRWLGRGATLCHHHCTYFRWTGIHLISVAQILSVRHIYVLSKDYAFSSSKKSQGAAEGWKSSLVKRLIVRIIGSSSLGLIKIILLCANGDTI